MTQPAPSPSLGGIKVLPDDVEKLLPVESSASLSGGITLTANDSHRTSPYLNDKIRNICLILSVLVVLNHSRTIDLEYGWDGVVLSPADPELLVRSPFEFGIQHLLSGALGRITNPLFFMASGFLFFFGWQPSLASWLGKMRKRVYTLVLPYFAWSFIGMTMNYMLFLADNAHLITAENGIRAISITDAMGRFLSMPAAPQLWFLRALMLMMACTPLLALVVCSLKRYALLLILAVFLSPFQTPWGQLSKSAICFFSLGAVLGYMRSDLLLNSRTIQKALLFSWLLVAGSYTVLSLFLPWNFWFLFNFVVLSGITGIWGLYDLLPTRAHEWLSRLSPYRFFIYMASEPLLTILQYKYFEFVHPSQGFDLLAYIGLPACVILVCGGTAYCLRRRAARFYLFLSGGR